MEKISTIINNVKVQILVIILLASAVYANTLSNEFVWDDKRFIGWELPRSFKNIPIFLIGGLPPPHQGDYRPIKGIILTIDYFLFRANPFGYHLQAILIHLASTLLVYSVVKLILKNRLSSVSASIVAFMTALIFGVHPIQTEAITFVTSSSDVIGVTFLLASFYFYLKNQSDQANRKLYLVLSAIFAYLAYLSYEMTFVLPLLIILYDLCFKRFSFSTIKNNYKKYLIYFGLLFIYLFLRLVILNVRQEEDYLAGSFYFTMLAMIKVVGKYILLIIWPVNLTINHQISKGISSWPGIEFNKEAVLSQSVSDPQLILSIGVIVLLLLIAVFTVKKIPIITFGIFWFFISIASVLNVIPISALMAERYLYMASIGYCLILAFIIFTIYNRFKGVPFSLIGQIGVVCFFIATLSFYSYRTVLRNFDWKDSFTLWSKVVKESPQSVIGHHNLGSAYLEADEFDKAIKEFEIASIYNSKNFYEVPLNLGIAYFKKNQFDLAQEQFQITIEKKPNSYLTHFFLAEIYSQKGEVDKAVEAYKKAVELNPNFYDPYINLGIIFAQQKKFDEAIELFKKAKRINKNLVQSYVNLGVIYFKQAKIDLAIQELTQALKIDPDNQQVKNNLQILLKQKNEY